MIGAVRFVPAAASCSTEELQPRARKIDSVALSYHVDYSEPYRHKTNVICPPIHAVTLQLTPLPTGFVVEGGMFGAHIDGCAISLAFSFHTTLSMQNSFDVEESKLPTWTPCTVPQCVLEVTVQLVLSGCHRPYFAQLHRRLEHYRAHGYKASLQKPTNGLPTADWGESDGWRFTPYRFNQATITPGDMPHAATIINSWPEGMKRLVIGINTCSFVEGPSEMDMPQHSRAFKRALKLRRCAVRLMAVPGLCNLTTSSEMQSCFTSLDLYDIPATSPHYSDGFSRKQVHFSCFIQRQIAVHAHPHA
eukprot:2009285-Pleurochrysis_carterae.AAC.4